MKRVIYYQDELNDDFSLDEIEPKQIDENYCYVHKSFFKKLTHFFWYRIVFTPIAFFHTKIFFKNKIVNKKILKEYKKSGYFLYGNHTQNIADAYIPNMITFPKDSYMIVHRNNVSMPILGKITPSLGALPIPDNNLKAYRNFLNAIETRLKQNACIVIYPEAHIWPYYTKIRPFVDTSFHYPIKYDVPSFCLTNTYQKRKFLKKPKIVTYIDGPFFPNKDLSISEQKKDLRDRIYKCMVERSKLSNVEYIEYKKVGSEND